MEIKYEGKAGKTLEEKFGSVDYKKFMEHCEELCNKPFLHSDIFNFPNTKPTYEDLEKDLQKHKDILWKQSGTSLMYDDKYYQRTTYQQRIKSEEELLKDEMYKINSVVHTICSTKNLTDIEIKELQEEFGQKDITHIITPSKNYFLFKLN